MVDRARRLAEVSFGTDMARGAIVPHFARRVTWFCASDSAPPDAGAFVADWRFRRSRDRGSFASVTSPPPTASPPNAPEVPDALGDEESLDPTTALAMRSAQARPAAVDGSAGVASTVEQARGAAYAWVRERPVVAVAAAAGIGAALAWWARRA